MNSVEIVQNFEKKDSGACGGRRRG